MAVIWNFIVGGNTVWNFIALLSSLSCANQFSTLCFKLLTDSTAKKEKRNKMHNGCHLHFNCWKKYVWNIIALLASLSSANYFSTLCLQLITDSKAQIIGIIIITSSPWWGELQNYHYYYYLFAGSKTKQKIAIRLVQLQCFYIYKNALLYK